MPCPRYLSLAMRSQDIVWCYDQREMIDIEMACMLDLYIFNLKMVKPNVCNLHQFAGGIDYLSRNLP